MKRTPLKRKSIPHTGTTLKRKSIKKKPLTAEEIEQNRVERDKMWDLFNRHWELKKKWVIVDQCGNESLQRVCESCSNVLWGENKSLYHHHILEKGNAKYEHLKYEIDNLMLLCEPCHSKTTNGHPSEKIKQKTEETKRKYNII